MKKLIAAIFLLSIRLHAAYAPAPVYVTSSALPTGAAKESTQLNNKVLLDDIATSSDNTDAQTFGIEENTADILTGLSGVTVNTHAVTQGSPWTVSGSVSVIGGMAGVSVTVVQGGPFTISGSVSTAGNLSLNAGTNSIGSVVINAPTTGQTVAISGTPAVTCAACATSVNQTSQITAEQAIQGTLNGATSTSAPFFINAGTSGGVASNLSQIAGTNINPAASLSLLGRLPILLYGSNGQVTFAGRPTDSPLGSGAQTLNVWSGMMGVSPTGTNEILVGTQIDSEGTTRMAISGPEYHTRSATYAVSASPVTPVASASDIFTITGSATKTVVIKRITISGAATLQGSYIIALVKRTAADTGGTSAAQILVPLDSNDVAATTTVLSYSANPVTASALATLQTTILPLGVVSGGATTNAPLILDFSIGNIKAIYLHGTSQVLAINGQQITAPSGTILNINAIVEEY